MRFFLRTTASPLLLPSPSSPPLHSHTLVPYESPLRLNIAPCSYHVPFWHLFLDISFPLPPSFFCLPSYFFPPPDCRHCHATFILTLKSKRTHIHRQNRSTFFCMIKSLNFYPPSFPFIPLLGLAPFLPHDHNLNGFSGKLKKKNMFSCLCL